MFVFPLGPRLVSVTDRCVQVQMFCWWAWPGPDSWEWVEGTSVNPSGNPACESHVSQNLSRGNEPPPVPPSQKSAIAKFVFSAPYVASQEGRRQLPCPRGHRRWRQLSGELYPPRGRCCWQAPCPNLPSSQLAPGSSHLPVCWHQDWDPSGQTASQTGHGPTHQHPSCRKKPRAHSHPQGPGPVPQHTSEPAAGPGCQGPHCQRPRDSTPPTSGQAPDLGSPGPWPHPPAGRQRPLGYQNLPGWDSGLSPAPGPPGPYPQQASLSSGIPMALQPETPGT